MLPSSSIPLLPSLLVHNDYLLLTNSFVPLHFGTFWGLPSRIFYIFVGLAPLILFITGFVIWRYRYKGKNRSVQTTQTLSQHCCCVNQLN
ncbi:MAG: PepSY-associated TM helix domain-containing protein [Nostoc sp.]|uniref:PepSY-associated TM helix domain-containing protein n=1 Tax=Nostoc sp. TaxID=1180 RepID=UPI002FF090FB